MRDSMGRVSSEWFQAGHAASVGAGAWGSGGGSALDSRSRAAGHAASVGAAAWGAGGCWELKTSDGLAPAAPLGAEPPPPPDDAPEPLGDDAPAPDALAPEDPFGVEGAGDTADAALAIADAGDEPPFDPLDAAAEAAFVAR
jgi:hypothetical protein